MVAIARRGDADRDRQAGRSCRAPFRPRSARWDRAEACRALVANRGARVPRFSLDRIVARHGDCPELRLALLERSDLPLEVRELLLGKLAEALRELDRRARLDHAGAGRGGDPRRARMRHHRRRFRGAGGEHAGAGRAAHRRRGADAGLPDPRRRRRADAAFRDGALERSPRCRANACRRAHRLRPQPSLRALLQKANLPQKTFPVFAAAIDVIRNGDPVADGTATIAAPRT